MRRLTKPEALAALADKVAGLRDAHLDPCVMCSIARGRWDRELVVAHEESVTLVLDRFASARGHLLAILRKHEEHVAALTSDEYLALQRVAHRASVAVTQLLAPRRTYIAVLGAPSAVGTSFPHVHAHVVPLTGDDADARPARVFSWSEGVYVYDPGEAEQLVKELSLTYAALP